MSMHTSSKCHCEERSDEAISNRDCFASLAMTGMRGFTLVELFIAISIFAVVAIALYSTFFAGISLWKRSAEGGNVYQDIGFIFDDITKDLKNSVYMDSEKEEESIYAFSGTDNEIIFITLESTFSEEDTPREELVKVAYRFDEGEDALIMVRADMSLGFDIEKAKEEILLKDIEDLKFEYCYDSEDELDPYLWEEEWEDDDMKIPRGIRVTFRIKTEREKKPLEFTKTIFVPANSILGKKLGL